MNKTAKQSKPLTQRLSAEQGESNVLVGAQAVT